MGKKKVYIFLSSLAILSFLLILVSSFEDKDDNPMQSYYQIFPVPIPRDLQFAGESVPIGNKDILERIDRELLVNTYWQSNTLLILKRSKRFFQVVEPILKEYGIPDDVKYLAIAESGMQNLTSPAGAKGVWQFMESTAKEYDLTVNSYVDERLDLEKSTVAACKYLKEAYNTFGSWTLAIASYNRGVNGLKRALDNQSVNNYYDLHLNPETSRYVPRVLALKTIIENPSIYGFKMSSTDYYSKVKFRVVVRESVPDLSQLALELGCTYHDLKELNPWIIGSELPQGSTPYNIKAPL